MKKIICLMLICVMLSANCTVYARGIEGYIWGKIDWWERTATGGRGGLTQDRVFTYYVEGGRVVISGHVLGAYANVKVQTIPAYHQSMKVEIEAGAFKSLPVEKVVFAEGFEYIPDYLFENNTTLKEVLLPESMQSIGKGAFKGCARLEKINTVNAKKIGDEAFKNCERLSVEIGKNVEELGEGCFEGCADVIGMERLLKPKFTDGRVKLDSLTYLMENNALTIEKCEENAWGDVTIPDEIGGYRVVKIGEGAFRNCKNITNVILPEFLEEIGDGAFSGCEKLESVSFNKALLKIGDGAFEYTTNLKEARLPDSMTAVGDSAFLRSGIGNLILGKNINTLGKNAFFGCINLKNIIIPDGVEDLGEVGTSAFFLCTGAELLFLGKSVREMPSDMIVTLTGLKNIMVSEENEVYKAADGVLYTKDMKKLVYYPQGKDDEVFVVPESVTEIGANAFFNAKVKKIAVHDNIINVGENNNLFYERKAASEEYEKIKSENNGAGVVSVKVNNVTINEIYEEETCIYISADKLFDAIGKKAKIDNGKGMAVIGEGTEWAIAKKDDAVIVTQNGNHVLKAPVKWINGEMMLPEDALTFFGVENIEKIKGEKKTDTISNGKIQLFENDIEVWDINQRDIRKHLVDGDLTTYLTGEVVNKGDPCWVVFDLKDVYLLDNIGIAFDAGNKKQYEFSVEISRDGKEYMTAVPRGYSTGTTNGLEYYSLKGESAQYVRLKGFGNSSTFALEKNWFTPTEVEIYKLGENGGENGVVKDTNITQVDKTGENESTNSSQTTPKGDTRLELSNCSITQSIMTEPQNSVYNLYDGSLASYCVLYVKDEEKPEYIQFDLGKREQISQLGLAFRNATSRTTYFDVRVSEDGINYKTIIPKRGSASDTDGLQYFDINEKARYIRVYGYSNTFNRNWVSITEAEVWIEGEYTLAEGENTEGLVHINELSKYGIRTSVGSGNNAIEAVRGDDYLYFYTYDTKAFLNGKAIEFEKAAEGSYPRYYVPIDDILKAFGVE